MSNTAAEYRKLSLLPPEEWTDEHADHLLEILALAQHDEQLALDIEQIDEEWVFSAEEHQ